MLNLVDAFLLASGVAYLAAALTPNKVMKAPDIPKGLEWMIFMAMGVTIIWNLFYNQSLLWTLLGVLESIACVMTFLGYQRWNVQWKIKRYTKEASGVAQIAMWAWDLAIAVCFFMKWAFTF